ncbi:MAG: hypothetical protein NW207_02030 [Cytophagales bacterium]|nr:hypothetical protein [Cytophagales bacterium]
MKRIIFVFFIINAAYALCRTVSINTNLDSLCGVKINRDVNGKLLPRYYPEQIGKSYAHVLKLTSEFIKNGVPLEDATGKKMYYATCCFQGPHMTKSTEIVQGKSISKLSPNQQKTGIVAEGWMHNPACVFAGLTQSLALDYYPYSGDSAYVQLVGQMLDYQLKYGTTPSSYKWAEVPYASSNPFDSLYYGATKWENEAMRGDGMHGIEPDKVGELGYAYLKYYELTLQKKYLDAALSCADALVANINKDVLPNDSPFITTQTKNSPWPFRVNARNGIVLSTYCAHVIEPIKLLDEALRIKANITLDTSRIRKYTLARKIAWVWLFSRNGPMKTYVWNAYFEDIPNDEGQANRNQVSPMETARYLLKNPEMDRNIDIDVPALIYYVKSAFGSQDIDAINEQTWCYEPMASHSARYASVCAMMYERTQNPWYKEQALRHFNYATYMVMPNGVAWVGHTWPGSWWSDGYGDYIKHYFDGMAAIPEFAPEGEDHILKSTSVVQKVYYTQNKIYFKTYDIKGKVILKLTSKPKSVTVNQKAVNSIVWQQTSSGGILRLQYAGGQEITILK